MNISKNELEILEIQPPKVKYSKYAISLDKIFKSCCLESLQYNIRHPRYYNKHENKVDDKEKHYRKHSDNLEIYKNFIDPRLKGVILPQIENLKKETRPSSKIKHDNVLTEVSKQSSNKKLSNFSTQKKKKKRVYNIDTPDPGQYFPNFNLVEKRVPAVIMLKPKIKQVVNTNDSFTERVNIDSSVRARSSKAREETIIKQDIANPTKMKKNKALRFSKYPDRKELKKWSLPILTYLKPFDLISKNHRVDFNKMRARKESETNELLNNSNPTVGYYEPKYNIVLKQSPSNVNYNPKLKNFSKHYLVQKIWRSYDVDKNYKLVNLN